MRRLITPNGYFWQSYGDNKEIILKWLAYLGRPDASVRARPAEGNQIYQAETAWRRRVAGMSPFSD